MAATELNEYVGSLHMHSVYSDGTGTVPEIMHAAVESGLDFIILTDHNTLRAKKEGYERFYNNTLLLVGYEINDKENKNHYLALRTDETYPTRMAPEDYVRKIKESGGIGFIAHPHEERDSMKEYPAYPWTAWDCSDIQGIEIWNHMSEWVENLTEANKYESFFHPLRSICAPPAETLRKWDELNQSGKVVGIGGIDAHAHKVNVLGFFEVEVFPYKVLFKSIRTHILSGLKYDFSDESKKFIAARDIIYGSLESGLCFVANDYIHSSTGFRFSADCGGREYQMGDTVTGKSPVQFRVKVPAERATVKLIHNGNTVSISESVDACFDMDTPGVYRVEVFLGSKAWIFSNHIRIEK